MHIVPVEARKACQMAYSWAADGCEAPVNTGHQPGHSAIAATILNRRAEESLQPLLSTHYENVHQTLILST